MALIYQQEDPSKAVVMTGPISGNVTLPDGTVYDVTPAFIEVTPGHELLVSDAIGARHEAEGTHPAHQPTLADPNPKPFVHIPSALSHGQAEAFSAALHDGDVSAAPADVMAHLTGKG